MNASPRLLMPGEPPRIIAHRGYSAKEPENSMAAFLAAVHAGARGIELDVHLSSWGEPIVFHDFSLERLHGDPRRLVELDSGEIASLGIPLLKELFATFADEIFYDIEIKSRSHGPTGVEAEVVRLLRAYGLEKRVLISSFNPHALRAAARNGREIPRGLIFAKEPDLPYLLRRGWGRFAVGVQALKPRSDLVTRRFMRRLGGRYAILPWTVDDPKEAVRLRELGVDGIITNDPVSIAEALA
ncbi:MAG: glycerophosphodiester phosphodiesterase [Spirochaetaceae bacterium]